MVPVLVSWRAWDTRAERRCRRRPLIWAGCFGSFAVACGAVARSPRPSKSDAGSTPSTAESMESLVDFTAGLVAPVAALVSALCVVTFLARWCVARRGTWRWVLVPARFRHVSVDVEASEGRERFYFALEPIASGPALVAGPTRIGPVSVSLLWSAGERRMRLVGGPRRLPPGP